MFYTPTTSTELMEAAIERLKASIYGDILTMEIIDEETVSVRILDSVENVDFSEIETVDDADEAINDAFNTVFEEAKKYATFDDESGRYACIDDGKDVFSI